MIEIILFSVMLTSLGIKWITTLSGRDRHTKLTDANDEYWRNKNRQKTLVSETSMSDHGIGRLERKIRAGKHRLAKITKEQGALEQDASSRTSIAQEKVRLAEEIRKKRDGK